MREGDVVLAPLLQAAGQVKNRPAVLLRAMPPDGDFLLCGVSTQMRQEVHGFDDPIRLGDPDFSSSGLKAPSMDEARRSTREALELFLEGCGEMGSSQEVLVDAGYSQGTDGAWRLRDQRLAERMEVEAVRS